MTDLDIGDARIEFVADYALTSLKIKPDKWVKMYAIDENKKICTDFFDNGDSQTLVVAPNAGGGLMVSTDWPTLLKQKAIFFVKNHKDAVPKNTVMKDAVFYGDVSSSPLEHLSVYIDEVLTPLVCNENNQTSWPDVVAEDVVQHVRTINSRVFVITGQIGGKTLLPLPDGADKVEHVGDADGVDHKALVHSIESVVIEWIHQIEGILRKDSALPLLDGLNPSPYVEFEFWKAKVQNLECIYEQLHDPKVTALLGLLHKSNSSYFHTFKIAFEELVAALHEAQDINLHLRPLRSHIEDVEQAELEEVYKHIAPMMHVTCLVWANSKYYCTPARIIVLLQEICNLFISQCQSFLEPSEIFKGEIEEVTVKVSTCLEILVGFKDIYNEYREKLGEYFQGGAVKEWEFAPVLVFHRYDSFIQRVRLVYDLFANASELLRLEKIEYSGLKGKILSAQTVQIFVEFNELFKGFQEVTYDCLDPKDEDFLRDYHHFKVTVDDLDLRLSSILCQAFEDCSGLDSMFKILDIFGKLLERPILKKDFDENYWIIIHKMDKELNKVKQLFEEQMERRAETGSMPIHKNMPPVAGALKWSQELRDRITGPMQCFRRMEHSCMESQDAKDVENHYQKMLEILEAFEAEVYASWVDGVDEACSFNLQQPLIIRDDETDTISVNFDPQLMAVLREVKYLLQLGKENIPESAADLYAQKDTLLSYVANLDLTVAWYNKIRKTVLEVEYPIIEEQLRKLDCQLHNAEQELNWTSDEVWEYIQKIRDGVHDLESRLQKSSDNVEQIRKIMSSWSNAPLFERLEFKGSNLLNLANREEKVKKRYDDIRQQGEVVHDLLKENQKLLKADKSSEIWLAYVDYIDEIVVHGFFNTVICTLRFMLDNTNSSTTSEPLLEAILELQASEMVFIPSLEIGVADGLYDVIDGLMGDVYKQGAMIKRLATESGEEHYQPDLENTPELSDMRAALMEHVNMVMNKAAEYQATFDPLSYLWTDDRNEYMRQFLEYGHVLTLEEIEEHAVDGIPESPPSLRQFRDMIDVYESLYGDVEAVQTSIIFDKWLRVDARLFRQALLNIAKKWSLMFKQHIGDHVINSLRDLKSFIAEVERELVKPLLEGDYDGLVKMIGILLRVKERQQATDEMFEPLRQTIELLKLYNQEMPDEVVQQLMELPDQWIGIKKLAVAMKLNAAPLQANEVTNIRRLAASYDVEQYVYREAFRKMKAFQYSSETPYETIDEENENLIAMEIMMGELTQSAALFEVQVPEYKQLQICRRELSMIKQLWDCILVVSATIDDWKTLPWLAVSIDGMSEECKKFAKDVRLLDKEMRAWDAYSGVEATVKNTMASLRAVGELQNPAIRDRHWAQLMQATGVKISITNKTVLADLMSLNLHLFEDEVKNVVDKAVKEVSMEKLLKEMGETWKSLEFEHLKHPRTGVTLLQTSEELIETLEDNQVQLQNMMSSKFIGYFLEEVSVWQKKLSTVDMVISIWMEVQRTWSHLESIFIGSEDIRKQLPHDSERFDQIDNDFKQILSEIEISKNVILVTCRPKLYDRLETIQGNLIICEKALAEYLETKRLAFPRFYFVSSVDLLDILSNGTNPTAVAKHLTKLFDSMAQLTFTKDQNGQDSKLAVSMISKDGESINCNEPCDCDGPVEIWLGRLLNTMRSTVRHDMDVAVITYQQKPREVWIFEPPAQVALCSVQIWWAVEVSISFQKLEEGYENALKDFSKKQISQLNAMIMLLIGKLSGNDRQKIMTICTIEVHNRDVVGKLITQKVENSQAFTWLSQLRHRWDAKVEKDCFANICDAQFRYQHEYLGNTPRLVITPLTDRCYITLTQSLHLRMSGAPAGPAGTGKTETTKDLGRALGVIVYVFNCSEQMDYKSIGNIYKGLAQSGAWGCFDEFNRISVEVLSVVAVQVKCIQDAIKANKKVFSFIGEDVKLNPEVGLFITMNPGYAGRAELPENLKALFRPCAMVVPDFELICEIMLVAEGFLDARLLARKFITLYSLCRELLSKQDHYDWGLRAIKSVLVVAGALKRSDPGRPEDQVLMRALRDFNIPKIVSDDLPVFMGLIGDLFPALNVPRKRDLEFEQIIKDAILQLHLQPEDSFLIKVVQLQELFVVRHSVFCLGNAGTGKSMVWKSLFKANQNMKKKPVTVDLNPKAVTNDELFGIIHPATREWKDGLFSTIMRDLANVQHDGPKWIVLDGDIDPMWIESLNTVMDDNKVLTLASNERIPLTPSMRLLFEISHLKTATPATVSRAGILYINPGDLGWNPFVSSWIETRDHPAEQASLALLFDKYVPVCLATKFKKITPISDISHLQMLCNLLECVFTPENVPVDCPKEWYELYFVFCCVWAFGGCLFQDQLTDWRVEYSRWFANEFKAVKFPSAGTVFDYYIDTDTKHFEPWSKRVPEFVLDPELPLQATLVHTNETIRISFFMDMLIRVKRPVMLVGNAGLGKTVITNEKLKHLGDTYAVTNVPFNFYTTSEMLQRILEKPLEKKAGRNYGPPGNKKLIYFIDDMNMPEVDKYFTAQPHTLMRQHIDYSHWYDRQKLSLKDIHNTQYLASMNPTSGSFTIDPRLQRHFCVFALSFPGIDSLQTIYTSILSQHLAHASFSTACQKSASSVVLAALTLHSRVAASFLPTAIKFHYVFNLRDLSNIFQGILFATNQCCKVPVDLVRLYMHEACRVYRDKLVDDKDIEVFDKLMKDAIKKAFEESLPEADLYKQPMLFCHFAMGMGEPKYMPVHTYPELNKILVEALDSHNEVQTAMNLVLFEDAISHILRINRILESPRGNALLVGVGGSGKQSLSRLAAFISILEVFQITLRKGYSSADLKADVGVLYNKAAIKNINIMFLMTDAQVADERFLVLINDLLASGEIPDLFADDEVEAIINGMRNEVKTMGLDDSKDNCWKVFINKVRRNLKVVLCFSPVGSTLRVRSRKFPAITNTTSIDWFHEWPLEALISVSRRFLSEVELLSPEMCESISLFMANTHQSVNEMSQVYLQNERRYNYTTPKSFLEQIKLYQNLLKSKNDELIGNMNRLENGLEKLKSTTAQVDELKSKLAAQEEELAIKNEAANSLISVVGAEQEKVGDEKAIAAEEQAKVAVIAEDVGRKQKVCEIELGKAEPALIAAKAALDTLNKNNLTELKSFAQPPPAVVNVAAAVLVLLSNKTQKVPKDRGWKASKIMMAKVDEFLSALINYDKENIPEVCQKAIAPYLKDPEFEPEFIKSKSLAAAGLCAWVVNIMMFYEVYCEVEPKRLMLEAANKQLNAANEKLTILKDKIDLLETALAKLTSEFEAATNAKLKCQQEADLTNKTITLANRLVGGLASENVRWGIAVNGFKEQAKTLPGDVLLTTAFISYVGCFIKQYRLDLMNNCWIPFLQKLQSPIPVTADLDPLSLLTDGAQIASWNNEGLPNDRMSTENATILTSAERWPLMIDPQLQGIKWIKTRYHGRLVVVRLGQKNYLDTMERAVSMGETVLIENLGESIDPVLDPIVGRNTIKKGRAIKLGDKEVEYNPNFRLILHTKLANPHYQPELQAQTTLINFTVTRDGLEDQLLAAVVAKERPDLEKLKADLTRQQNEFKITLKQLEDSLLHRLSAAEGNFLGDYALVENLETTKRTAIEIEEKVNEAKITEVKINEAREMYRPAAARASLLYFILNDLNTINPIYVFSLKAFSVVFEQAIDKSEPAEEVKQRVINLIDCITFSVFSYTSRGLFERDKIIFMAQMAFLILLMERDINPLELDFLLRFPAVPGLVSPADYLSNLSWGGIKTLASMDEFKNLDRDIEGSLKRWKKFVDCEAPEKEKFPQEWKNKQSLQKLCMMRALRPDRMTYAVRNFVEEKMGTKYVEARSIEFSKSFEESGPATPMFFILSPGVDPLKDVEALGKKLGFSTDLNNFHNISLGQGQEVVAERAIDLAGREGHWVILQNVHLVARWLPTLEKKLEQYAVNGHARYRVFISAEPASTRDSHIIPPGILESAIKITNEPPTGMMANLHKAFDNFDQDTLEMSSRESEFKNILFSLCYFHAVVCERRKFGPQGWNRSYPFNVGDLTISVNVLYNYLEANAKVPWEDLRYLFGEIMYGGHITDDWDRRLCRTYLEEYVNSIMMDGDLYLAPGFLIPPNTDYKGYHVAIDETLPTESPYLYGLHPNAEIEFLSTMSENLFRTLFEMQPRDTGAGAGGGVSREEKIKIILDDILGTLPDEFPVIEIMAKVPLTERTPYVIVAFQECERMNYLTSEIRRSLKELDLGLKGELTITSAMETLGNSLFLDVVPESWSKRAYPSLYGLTLWYSDMLLRIKELESWTADFQLPAAVWLAGFFNPQSFLTAIMQQMARKNEWPLDKMCLQCDVTKKNKEDMSGAPREGAYVHGLFMEGARWDTQTGLIAESRLKELAPPMPVIFIKAIPVDRQEIRNVYECPVYKTKQRGPTFVWTFNLKSKEKAAKWTMGGVALLLQV